MSEYTTRQILDMIEENEGPEGLDLSGASFGSIDLSRDAIQAELKKAPRGNAHSYPVWVSKSGGVTLARANLQEAYLGSANLWGADLWRANLGGAYLGNAKLMGAGLEGANLQGADLMGADLQEAELKETDLREANLQGANLEGASLYNANLEGAYLDSANLEDAILGKANLHGACLREANLQWAYLADANLEGAMLHRANLQGADLQRANLHEADLREADLQGAELRETDLHEADLREADLQGAELRETDLREANLREANLRGSFFVGARLHHTDMDQRSLGPAIGEELSKGYERARDAYLRLKQNFDDLGDYSASAWAYQKERQMEKKCNAPWRARSAFGEAELRDASLARVCLFYARHTVKWILDWIVEYLCDYGENPIRVLLWMAVSLLGFATYYWSIGAVWLVDAAKGPIATANSFWHYLIYSLGAFTTTQFARFQPADDRVRLATGIQAIWGIFLAGLLGFVVANRIRRS